MQGKAISSFVQQKMFESWLEWKGPSQIGKDLRLLKQTIAKIVDIFVCRGNMKTTKEEIILGSHMLTM